MNKELKYVVKMDVKWWSGGYGTKTMVFKDEADFDQWWSDKDDSTYKVIGIINQSYKRI